MATIEQILKDNWYTISEISKCMNKWCCNWLWPYKHNFFKYLPNFKSEKFQTLKKDLNYISCIHDIAFTNWWNLLDFLRANYILWLNIIKLLHWTNFLWRLFIFLIFFLWTTLFGGIYFSWWKQKNGSKDV